MAPIRETYVPVPGLDYIEPLSERKSFAKHASSTANSQIPLTPSKKSKSKTTAEVEAQAKAKAKAKTKAKAEVEPKVKAKAKSAEQPAKKRKSEQDSALDKTGDASTPIASKPRWPKSDGYSLTKNASGTKEKAATASKTKEKPKPKAAVRPSNKFLSAELVTVSDDEDSDDGDMHKGDKRQVESNGKYRRRDNDGRIGGSARGDRSMGKTDERFTTSTSRSGSEESGEESGNNINTNNTGKNEKPGLSVRTNGAAPKRARSMSASTSSTSDSSSESVHSHACDDMPKKGNGKEKERSGKNDIVSSMQSAANGRPAKRAKSSSSSNTSTSSDDSNSAYSDEDKMDVDSSIAVGIGPSAQPKLKVNGMMFNGIGDRNGTRQAPLKQQASKPLLNGTRNTTSSSDSGSDSSSSSSQSDSEGNDAMDTSSDKHIPTTTATGKALKSSRTTGTPIQVPKSRKTYIKLHQASLYTSSTNPNRNRNTNNTSTSSQQHSYAYHHHHYQSALNNHSPTTPRTTLPLLPVALQRQTNLAHHPARQHPHLIHTKHPPLRHRIRIRIRIRILNDLFHPNQEPPHDTHHNTQRSRIHPNRRLRCRRKRRAHPRRYHRQIESGSASASASGSATASGNRLQTIGQKRRRRLACPLSAANDAFCLDASGGDTPWR